MIENKTQKSKNEVKSADKSSKMSANEEKGVDCEEFGETCKLEGFLSQQVSSIAEGLRNIGYKAKEDVPTSCYNVEDDEEIEQKRLSEFTNT